MKVNILFNERDGMELKKIVKNSRESNSLSNKETIFPFD